MTIKTDGVVRTETLFWTAGLIAVLMLAVCSAVSAQVDERSDQAVISKEEAAAMIIDTLVKNLTEGPEIKKGLRVNQYPELLTAGTRVVEAQPDGAETSQFLVMENASWLFFLDLAPGAHFSHPVIIAVLDAVSGEVSSMDSQWWPVLEVPVFSQESQRQEQETIIYEVGPGQ